MYTAVGIEREHKEGSEERETEEYRELLDHRAIRQQQRAAYAYIRDHVLKESAQTLLATIDFTSHQLPHNISTNNKDKEKKVEICVIVLLWRDSSGELHTHNLSFMCSDPNTNANNHQFVRHVLNYLFAHTSFLSPFNTIFFFSDTGPHHFRINQTQLIHHKLAQTYNKTIIHNFFCPQHGHSLSDGHAGHIKRAILQYYIGCEGETKRGVPSKEKRKEIKNAHDVKLALDAKHMPHTTSYVFDSIPQLEDLQLIPIKHIRQYYQFTHTPTQSLAYTRTQTDTHSSPATSLKFVSLRDNCWECVADIPYTDSTGVAHTPMTFARCKKKQRVEE